MAYRGYIDSSDQPDGWMAIAFLFLSLLGVRLSGVKLGPVDIVRFAEAFGAKGLETERPDEISSTLKKALAMEGPVLAETITDWWRLCISKR